jgi:two-component system response regulator YesN
MSLKFVLIDDEYLVRERLKHIIDWECEGYSLIGEAENGQDGLVLLEQLDPDLAIIDINMPLLSGLEMAAKAQAMNKKVRIIILSGYNDFEYARSAISLGVCCYLLKPVKKEELLDIIHKIQKDIGIPKASCTRTVNQAIAYINENFKEINLNIDMIAQSIGINSTYLSSKFKKETGRKLVDEINIRRLKEAEEILKKENLTLQELADQVGYNDPYYMSRCFKKYLGYSPSQIKIG